MHFAFDNPSFTIDGFGNQSRLGRRRIIRDLAYNLHIKRHIDRSFLTALYNDACADGKDIRYDDESKLSQRHVKDKETKFRTFHGMPHIWECHISNVGG